MSQGTQGSYLYDVFIEEGDKSPQEFHLEKFKRFISDYGSKVAQTESQINTDDNTVFAEVWDPIQDPIKFQFTPHEVLRFDEMIVTENKLMQKIILVFANLNTEMQSLKHTAVTQFFPSLSIFGESVDDSQEDGEKQLQFGRTLPLLMDFWNFVERINIVVKNVIQQLASLYGNGPAIQANPALKALQQAHFLEVFEELSDLLGVIITLDETITQNRSFHNHLTLYNRMIMKVMAEPERYGTTKKAVGRVQYLLHKIDGDVLDDNILKSCIQRSFDEPGISVQSNKIFKAEFEYSLKAMFQNLSECINTTKETDHRYKFVGFCGTYLFYYNLFLDTSDKKFFRRIWDMHKLLPIIHLYGNTVWSCSEFFNSKTPDLLRLIGVKYPKKEIDDVKMSTLKVGDDNLAATVQAHYLQLCVWTSRIESMFAVESDGKDVVGIQGTLILQGIQLAFRISNLLKTQLYLHILAAKPLSIPQVVLLCRCIEMLKTIKITYGRKTATFAKLISTLTEFLSFKIEKLLLPLKNRLETKKKQNDTDMDQLSSVLLAFHLLGGGSPSRKRLLLIKLTLQITLQKTTGLFKESEFDEIRGLLKRLDVVSDFESSLNFATDCSLIYWSKTLIRTFFDHVYECPERAAELKYIFNALEDPKLILERCSHLPESSKLCDRYRDEITEMLQQAIIKPLCTEVETDLRLNIHSSVTLGQHSQNLNTVKNSVKDVTCFFKIRPIRFLGKYIDISQRVSHYLNDCFYELTTVGPHNWKTYEEMRSLASEKYGLELLNVYLPGQTLEQGLDILQITRNIHLFVSNYSYNLNIGMFIEKCSTTDSKNLNTVHIKHVANSIRTHGTGIMNTTVNFVYQFLGKKFYLFSQFLFDDHIKSPLLRDMRYFKDHAMSLDNQYPLKRAMKFVKGIKKLGVARSGLSYLDQFRQLITEIGNALGYVRMVRAGGLRYISDAIKFVPDLDTIENFTELVDAEKLSNCSKESAKNLFDTLNNLSQKFAEGSDYFKSLESVFTKEMQNDDLQHLRSFYMIVPPLTLSFVEYMMIAKDKMIRSGKESNFTDDGFALGLAFILKILNQNQKFDSLHWFESVARKYDEEFQELKKSMSDKGVMTNAERNAAKRHNPDDELQTMRLTLTRITNTKREFELLFFSFSGSRVFFRD
ncbi:WASH complex subunit 7 [Acrasis kona]|uniref:WASH complex subunit 7 n=1 Tax=Acrasis kona TaxID=1008807 RepID=A0AAW2YJZ0_9EUKA